MTATSQSQVQLPDFPNSSVRPSGEKQESDGHLTSREEGKELNLDRVYTTLIRAFIRIEKEIDEGGLK